MFHSMFLKNQYYTPPVLNVYNQKTPLHGGAYWLYKD